MVDIGRAADSLWDDKVIALYRKFLAKGGDPALWAKANPELGPAPIGAQPAGQTNPDAADAGLLRWAGAAWDIAQQSVLASLPLAGKR